MKQLVQEERALSFLMSSVFMQYGISLALGLPITQITYQYNEFGKPMLADLTIEKLMKAMLEESVVTRTMEEPILVSSTTDLNKIDFNLSHSGTYAVLAVSDQPIGIDIEKKRHNRANVAKRCFCDEEYRNIMEAESEEEQDIRFFDYWTMKEAYIKRNGAGLKIPLNSFLIHRKEGELSYTDDVYFITSSFGKEQYRVSICSEQREEMNNIARYYGGLNDYIREITLDDVLKESKMSKRHEKR